MTLHLPRKRLRHRAELAATLARQFQAELVDVRLPARDHIVLNAWYAQPHKFSGASVILLHGVTDNREGVAGYAEMFLQHGYSVLLPDSRAHGESGGTIATYGIMERYEVRDWARWLKSRSPGCVYLFGESMGAAIALQAAAVSPDLCAVTVEAAFADFREVAYDRIARYTGFGLWFAKTIARPTVESALFYARVRYHIDLREAAPLSAVSSSHIPILLIHGTADKNIPMKHSVLLMRAGADHAELWQVPGAGHGGAINIAPAEFERRIVDWFDVHHQPVGLNQTQ